MAGLTTLYLGDVPSTSQTPTYGIDQNTLGYYNTAGNTYNQALAQAGAARGYNEGLTGTISDFDTAYQNFQTQYSPVLSGILGLAGQETQARSDALAKLTGADTADYSQEAGQAMTDVEVAARNARAQTARELARQGISMASGRRQALEGQANLDAALAKANAGTAARQKAADTAYAQGLQTYSAVNPSTSLNSALGITGAGTNLLTQKAGLQSTQATNAANLAGTMTGIGSGQAGLASSYGNLGLGYNTLNQTALNQAKTNALTARGQDVAAQTARQASNNGLTSTLAKLSAASNESATARLNAAMAGR